MNVILDPKQKIARMARCMRLCAAQASAIAAVLEKAEPQDIEHTGDLVIGVERDPVEIPDEGFGMITFFPSGGQVTVTFEGNLRITLSDGGDIDSFFKLFRQLKAVSP